MTWDQPSYGTHLPMLAAALTLTDGPVLELGAGDWSTPFLHQLCWDRRLVTVEPFGEWRNRFIPLTNLRHEFYFELDEALIGTQWGVALIDQAYGDRRADDIHSVSADIYVVHDTQPEWRDGYPGMEEALQEFKYRYDFTGLWPSTTLVSNMTDLRRGI